MYTPDFAYPIVFIEYIKVSSCPMSPLRCFPVISGATILAAIAHLEKESQMPTSAAARLVDALLAHGVDRAFCVPGESYLNVLDALRDSGIDTIAARQEGGACMMAEADAKLTGRPGVCFVTRGPGATNASSGVHVAEQDSTPLILFVGGLLGLFIGLITAYGRIPSFITTLAALIAFRGLALTFNNGSPIFSLDPALEPIFYGKFMGIPLPFFYLVFFYGLAAFTMNFTKLGREIYAVGGNPAAAVLTGINVRKVQTTTFVIAGFMTAVGAILMSARLNSGSPNYGQTLELQAIAAAVVGGASLAGGRGNILATLMGAMTIVIVQNGLNLNAAPSSVQNIVLGLIILMAVGIDMWRTEISALMGRLFGRSSSKQTSNIKKGA